MHKICSSLTSLIVFLILFFFFLWHQMNENPSILMSPHLLKTLALFDFCLKLDVGSAAAVSTVDIVGV